MKTYCEFVASSSTTINNPILGLIEAAGNLTSALGTISNSIGYYPNGDLLHNNTTAGTGSTWGLGDVIGMIFDDIAATLEFLKNGSTSVTFTGVGTGTWYPAANIGQNDTVTGHFDMADWVYFPDGVYGWSDLYYDTPSVLGSIWDWNSQINDVYGSTQYYGADTQEIISTNGAIQSVYGHTSGQWWLQLVPQSFPTENETFWGIIQGTANLSTSLGGDYASVGLIRDATNGYVYTNGSVVGWLYPISTADPISIGVDCDAGTVTFCFSGLSVTSTGHDFSTDGAYFVFRGVSGDKVLAYVDYYQLIGNEPTELSGYLPWYEQA